MPSHYKNSPVPKGAMKKDTITLGGKKITMKKDALRDQLKVPEGRDISMALLNRIIKAEVGDMLMNPYTRKDMKVTGLLKKRATLGRTLKRLPKK